MYGQDLEFGSFLFIGFLILCIVTLIVEWIIYEKV